MSNTSPIREWRKLRGYTQEELAERLRVAAPTVSNWERGVNTPPQALVEKCEEALRQARYVLAEIEAAGLNPQQRRTLEGLVRKGDYKGAHKGVQKLIRRRERENEPKT